MTGKDVAQQQEGTQLPELHSTPALEIEGDDVALPRLYLGQFMSNHVQGGDVPAGCVFVATGQDDPDPQVLWEKDQADDQAPLFHVLAMRKGKSLSEDGELQLFAFDDPNAPADAWTTYNYVIALPEFDADIPYKWLLTRTGTPAAKQINLILRRNAARGPAHIHAFRVTTAYRENTKGKWYVPQVHNVEADKKNIEVAESFMETLSGIGDSVIEEAPSEDPAI